MTENQRCTKCGIVKRMEQYPIEPRVHTGRARICKECKRKRQRDYDATKRMERLGERREKERVKHEQEKLQEMQRRKIEEQQFRDKEDQEREERIRRQQIAQSKTVMGRMRAQGYGKKWTRKRRTERT